MTVIKNAGSKNGGLDADCVGRAILVAFAEEGDDYAGWYLGSIHMWYAIRSFNLPLSWAQSNIRKYARSRYTTEMTSPTTPTRKKNCELTFADEDWKKKHFWHLQMTDYGRKAVGGWFFVKGVE